MTVPDPEVSGIVLAGGGATRLGSAAASGKAWLEFEGRTFLERVCGALAGQVSQVVVVAAPGQDLPRVPAATVVRDTAPAAGPLAAIRDGIRAAVETAGARSINRVVIASCDVPLLGGDVVRLLVEESRPAPRSPATRWTVPVVQGHWQVLLSVLAVGLLPQVEAWLAAGRRDPRGLVARLIEQDPASVRLLDERLVAAVEPTLASFVDVDTPDDLRRLQAR